MPRRARLAIANIAWHIIQRGNNRSACFFNDDDRRYYLHHLNKHAREFECAIHAYYFMTDHAHLLVTPRKTDSTSLMMKHLGQKYVQYINRNYRRGGTLWEGRFKSSLAQDEGYVLTCYRYIELNPVRARIVPTPQHYPWSSYTTNAMDATNSMITPHSQYTALGRASAERSERHKNFVASDIDDDVVDEIRHATQGNYVLGNSRLKKRGSGRTRTKGKNCKSGLTHQAAIIVVCPLFPPFSYQACRFTSHLSSFSPMSCKSKGLPR